MLSGKSSEPTTATVPPGSQCRPVGLMQLCHLLFQLFCLGGGKLEVTEVMTGVLFRVIVPELGLQCVRSQEGVSHKGAGQATRGNVLPELKAQEVSVKNGEERAERTVSRDCNTPNYDIPLKKKYTIWHSSNPEQNSIP